MAGKKNAGAKAPAEQTRTEEVGGLAFEVYEDRLRSWKAARLMSTFASGKLDDKTMAAMVGLVELATSLDEEAVVGHCGGDAAPFADVAVFLADVVQKVIPKN